MITIAKGMTNSCVFTLNEKITLVSPSIILEVVGNQNNDTKVMWLNTDVSSNTTRWNEYNIEETNSEDLTSQKISLQVTSYDYFVWQTDSATLSTTYATSVIESGKLVVTGTSSISSSTFDGGKTEYTFR